MPKTWVFEEAEKIATHIARKKKTGEIIFETGFGPSGLPHIGTFAEVTRTTFVRDAFEALTGAKSKLIAFSDDMDGLRKVPLNIPHPENVRPHLGKPLCTIPDPFGVAPSYSGHMNMKLVEFLNRYHLPHEYRSSQDQYKAGTFNPVLSRVMESVERIKGVILPTLQKENRTHWSPFMPTCEKCGRNLTTVVTEYDTKAMQVAYLCETATDGELSGCGHKGKRSILDGGAKVGWKVDWALRWTAFDVDYEMYGKDLIESYNLSKQICRILGGTPPQDMMYEMFLDEEGKKISKSVGKGLTIDTWISYAPLESLSFYLFQNPRRAKKLHFDVIPRCADEYLDTLKGYETLATEEARRENPLWSIHHGKPPHHRWGAEINYSLIQNLVSALGTNDRDVLMKYIRHYDPKAEEFSDLLNAMIEGARRYFEDNVKPHKKFVRPSETEAPAVTDLIARLSKLPGTASGDEIQTEIFSAAKNNGLEPKAFFQVLYKGLLGQENGPRLGAFFKLLTLPETTAKLKTLV